MQYRTRRDNDDDDDDDDDDRGLEKLGKGEGRFSAYISRGTGWWVKMEHTTKNIFLRSLSLSSFLSSLFQFQVSST